MTLEFDTSFTPHSPTAGHALDRSRMYDVLVLGAGPAGISAAIYLMRKGLDTGVIAGDIGGQVGWTATIENYLGYRIVEGLQLVEKFNEQVGNFPAAMKIGEKVTEAAKEEGHFSVAVEGERYTARSLVLATGKRPRLLNVPGEKRLLGRGVAYCAICDAPLYKGKTTAVIGGGNSGLEAAVDLAKTSPKVYLIESRDLLSGDGVLVEKVNALDQIEVLTGTEAVEILGEDSVTGLKVKNSLGGEIRDLTLSGVFIEIGLVPNSDPFSRFVTLNMYGEVEVDCLCRTSVEGVFAAGDVTSVPYKQIIVAAGEGAKAALSASDYLLRSQGSETG